VAVDERPEVVAPAHAHFRLLHVVARREPDLRAIRTGRYREEVKPTREVDDLAVIGGGLLRHAPAVSQREP
jgi:hypothetical protein